MSFPKLAVSVTIVTFLILLVLAHTTGLLHTMKRIVIDQERMFTTPKYEIDHVDGLSNDMETIYLKKGYYAFSRNTQLYIWSSKGLESFTLPVQSSLVCEKSKIENMKVSNIFTVYKEFNISDSYKSVDTQIKEVLKPGMFIDLLLNQDQFSKEYSIAQIRSFECDESI